MIDALKADLERDEGRLWAPSVFRNCGRLFIGKAVIATPIKERNREPVLSRYLIPRRAVFALFHEASIYCLNSIGIPCAIAWHVMPIHIHALYGQAGFIPCRNGPLHKLNKVRPLRANINSTPTVVVPSWVVRIATALAHCLPNHIKWRAALSMSSRGSMESLHSYAAAIGGLSRAKACAGHRSFIPALATTYPERATTCSVATLAHNRPAPKRAPRHFDQPRIFHAINYTYSPLV